MKYALGLRLGWATLLVACVLPVGLVDAVLLEASQTFFTAGFNGVYIEGIGPLLAFALISLLADFCLALGVWALVLPPLARWRGTALQKLVVAGLAALAIPLSVDFVRYQVAAIVGRMTSIPIVWEVSGGGFQLMLAEAATHAGPLVAMLLVAALAGALLVVAVGRLERRWAAPAVGGSVGGELAVPGAKLLWGGFAALLLCSALVLVATDRVHPRLAAGLAAKPSVSIFTGVIRVVTDVDRDGFGLLSRPRDPAPFDGSRHPYAIDVAGNGVDENGMAGDLPADVRPLLGLAAGPVPKDATRRPDFLLVYLESFRADLLGREREGRQITPFLDALAREGASSNHAYVHSPYTIGSRAQLFGGTISPRRGAETLVDDFRAQGYTVAHFSGQDDSFGDSIELLGLDRVDHLYDARQDRERRTSRGTSAGSLQVSWKVLAERVGAYLDVVDLSRPLFLYVNVVDTHFPYTHEEIDDLLGVEPLTRYEISVQNAERVRATYDNTAANVDLAARKVVARFREAIGGRDHAILVTSDHGQSLFERDSLGHGQFLTQEQTRAPFILWGVGGVWPEPLGIADVRPLLLQHLFVEGHAASGVPRARFVPQPERRLFHFMARLTHPHLIGLRGLDGLTSFDFDREALELYGADDQPREAGPEERSRAFEELIRAWEATRAAIPDEPSRARGDPGPA